MNINKAIRKQIKSYKRFMLSMCFVFFALPSILMFYKKVTIFYISYLALIEAMILISVIISSNREILKFQYETGKIKLKSGLNSESIHIVCSKILYVDIELIDGEKRKIQDFKIILLSNSKFKNKKMRKVDYDFMKKYTLVAYHYKIFKSRKPEDEFYYIIVSSGGLIKYRLLNTIFKGCVYAGFSEAAIERIKLYRDNLG